MKYIKRKTTFPYIFLESELRFYKLLMKTVSDTIIWKFGVCGVENYSVKRLVWN